MYAPLNRDDVASDALYGRFAAVGIALSAAAVYAGSLGAPFIYDDRVWITGNPSIRHLGSIATVLWPGEPAVRGRPVLSLSLAFNHALGGEDPWGYHLANLAVHVLAALALFGIVARTLAFLPEHFPAGRDRILYAFSVALLWAVHPLQTESVTYASQRSESLMGLFYLLTLYAFIRGAQAPGQCAWLLLSVAACALGMATKEVMVTAPLIVLAYDRTFVAGSFRGALRLRRGFYAALASTWLILGLLSAGLRGRGVGYGLAYSWWGYALTECWAVGHYILLALWPYPLVLDYGTVVIGGSRDALPWACVLAVLIGMTAVAFARRSALGFCGACFFLVLAPASSVVPVAFQPMAEHRMYLPLAAVVSAGVAEAWAWLGRRAVAIVAAAAIALGIGAHERNKDYGSETSIWADTVLRRPGNPRARLALGEALSREARHAEAAAQFAEALRLDPGDFEARRKLGLELFRMGRVEEALAQYRLIAPPTPDSAQLHYDIAMALERFGRPPEAAGQYREALRLDPGLDDARAGLRRLGEPR
jgi:tetratricopeptide (TPR) repeat protein